MGQQNIKFSVVTVCLNAEATISDTINSVKRQTYLNYEYIIWDGLSKDGTLELIQKNASADNMVIFSRADSGLYNAMNQAIKECSGDYILFLNSGDIFADENVLSDVADLIVEDGAKADLYFGNVLRKRADKIELETYHGRDIVLRLLLSGRMPCHQSIFTRLKVMQKYGFDERYFITADYNFLMKCRRYKHPIKYVDRVVSCFDCTQGISSTSSNLEEMRRQDDASMKELYPVWFYILKPIKGIVRCGKNILFSINTNGVKTI